MKTYAVLGATGSCGSALVDNLIRRPDTHIHAYCRDELKFHRLFPDAAASSSSSTKRLQIFSGRIDDVTLMTACIRNCAAVFLAVSTNVNIPGCSMAQTSAATVLAALEALRTENETGATGNDAVAAARPAAPPPPTLVLLSSASLDAKLSRHEPRLLHWVLVRAASFVYEDLWQAELLLRAGSPWVRSVFIKPAMLSADVQRGHALSADAADAGTLSYLDVAAGMIEAANAEDERHAGENLAVVNVMGGAKARFDGRAPPRLLLNLLVHFVPWLYPYIRYVI